MLEIIVPATSANIGPGFDTLGLALNIYNKFYITEINEGLEIIGCDDKYKNEDNLVYKSIQYFYKKVKPRKNLCGLKIEIVNDIPICKGLGSSATCIVAGILAANILSESNLSKHELLKIATEIEGHPDNIAPALFGNLVVSIMENNDVYYDIIDFPEDLSFCALIPDFELSTSLSRDVLTKKIKFSDGVYNLSRSSLLISSIMNRNFDLIKFACKDKLHQDYRGPLINNYDDIVNESINLGSLGVFLSGAGPTILCIIKDADNTFINDIKSFMSTLDSKWEVKHLKCDKRGSIVNIL